MKTKLNFDFPLTDLDGAAVQPEQKAGKVLAVMLANQPKGNALKFYEWALAMNGLQPIAVDTADKLLLQKFIEDCDNLTVLAKAQMLLAMLQGEAVP